MAVMDASDDDIESWITVRGNHIPIRKGQSKEEAVKSFIAGKKKNLVENHNSLVEAMNLEEKGYFKKDPKKRESITQSAIEMGKEEKNLEELMEFGVKEGNAAKPESKKEYPAEFETVRKNAKANPYLYDLRYTQKSKAKAYEEYKKDTEKKGSTMRISLPEGKERKEIIDRVLKDFHKNYDKLYKDDKLDAQGGDLVKKFDKDMKESSEFKEFVREVVKQRGDVFSSDREVKALMMAANEYGLVVGGNSEKKEPTTKQSDSPLVNAVARSLNMSAENAEKEVNGAVQHIKDLIKAKDLRNGDVEETLQGLGIESDYAEEFMEWVSAPTKKKATASKKKKEPAIVREGGVNWVDEKAWNDPRSDPWYALYE